MKTETAIETAKPKTEIERFSAEVCRRLQSVGAIESSLADSKKRAAQLSLDVESGETQLIMGELSREAFDGRRQRLAETEAGSVKLCDDLRIEKRLLELAETALERAQSR